LTRFLSITAIFIIFILCFSGCSDSGAEAESREETRALSEIISSINETLTAASKGADNPLARLSGLSPVLNSIKEKSEEAISRSDALQGSTALAAYLTDFTKYNTTLNDKLAEIKQARQDKDIDSLTEHLNEMETLIDDYSGLLSLIEEETSK
jgi:uncharacterized phage infection (PIP) family protein YhgE